VWCKYTLSQWQLKISWLKVDGIFRLLKRLEQKGIIKSCKPDAAKRDQTKWYRIDYMEFEAYIQKCISASGLNESLASGLNEISASGLNDQSSKYSLNINKNTIQECEGETQEIKQSVKTSTVNEPVRETNQLPLELKNKNLSEPPENQDPPIAAAPPRDPMGDRFKSGKSLKYPIKLIGSSYEKWHTGESLLSWDESLVTVAIAQLKKHNKPCARFDAINSLNNICHQEDWAKLELLISAIAVAKPITTFVDSTQVSDRAGIDHTKIPKETMEKLRKQREELNAKWKTV